MTITAVWPISSEQDPNAGDSMTITDPGEIETLVSRLSEPTAGAAAVWHEGRELADEDAQMHDHDVMALVSEGYGYLSYIDADHDYAVLDGDPASPAWNGEDVDFPEGSGVSPETLAEALREFLDTGQRPESVEWQPAEW